MKFTGTCIKVVMMFLLAMALSLSLIGCGNSSDKKNPDPKNTVNQPPTENKEEPNKTVPAAPSNYEKLLTAADVEQITGYKGVKLVPFNSQVGAGGKLNFTDNSGNLILAVMVEDSLMFDSWKANKDLNAAPVPGLGDEAFQNSAGSDMYTPNVTFIKGEQAIQLFTFFNMNDNLKPYLNHEQLIKLAKIVEGRM